MIESSQSLAPTIGNDCRDLFRAAYENRYTWEPAFSGYQGHCLWSKGENEVEGTFTISSDLNVTVAGIDNLEIQKSIQSQLWEVTIHRVRRSFDQVHSQNTFTVGTTDDVGIEVLVGGKNAGDRYKIKDNVVTMVHRHIHGNLINILTKSVTETNKGYLSHIYTSQYCDISTEEPLGGKNHFKDIFVPLEDLGEWVLTERIIETEAFSEQSSSSEKFNFINLKQM